MELSHVALLLFPLTYLVCDLGVADFFIVLEAYEPLNLSWFGIIWVYLVELC